MSVTPLYPIILASSSNCITYTSSEPQIKQPPKRKTKPSHQEYALGFIQLKKSTEKELVRNGPPGQLTVTVLLDSVTPDEAAASPLLQAYDDIVGGFSR